MKKFFYFILALVLLSCSVSKKAPVVPVGPVQVKLTTDSGTIILELSDKTPLHRDNFVKLIKEKVTA